ncbi:hypothetical protein [Roseospira navarrensis]|uniref:DUF1640 domain-containing protein n=1 Tax=Roseospira navarrensis TaxID=140058 RepID=A0A7X2D5A7_9PROT|nr:hypothetical protein [Roseospira navarrensis]MQX37492.1 hypothetical protein [Roseospira navarrensis]
MLEQRVQILEERTGRIESKVDAITVKVELMADQQSELRADMRAMIADLRTEQSAASEGLRADMRALASDFRTDMAAQTEAFRTDMKAMAGNLKSVEVSQADIQGQLARMPSTWTMTTTFMGVSLAFVTLLVAGIALIPVIQGWLS